MKQQGPLMWRQLTTDRYPPITSQTHYPIRHAVLLGVRIKPSKLPDIVLIKHYVVTNNAWMDMTVNLSVYLCTRGWYPRFTYARFQNKQYTIMLTYTVFIVSLRVWKLVLGQELYHYALQRFGNKLFSGCIISLCRDLRYMLGFTLMFRFKLKQNKL